MPPQLLRSDFMTAKEEIDKLIEKSRMERYMHC
jgi:hypothetical protein